MSSRNEELLNSIAEGTPSTIEPRCRSEKFLSAIANNEGTSNLPTPTCRSEELLLKIAEKGMDKPDQTKIVTPTETQQVIKPDAGYELGSVVVDGIQTEEKTAVVNGVVMPTSGKYLSKVTVNVPSQEPNLIEKQITNNGTYNAITDNADGYSKVVVNTDGAVDRLQYRCDNLKSLRAYFTYYSGASVDEYLEGIDTSKVENFYEMFSNAKVTSVPIFDTTSAVNWTNAFYKCINLKEFLVPIKKAVNAGGMFNECTSLHTIKMVDLAGLTINADRMFNNCKALKNLNLRNITHLWSLTIGSGTTYGHLLTLDSLINTMQQLWNATGTGRYPTLTMGSANLAKIADVYIKLIDITDEMRAEDEHIDKKLPFEVCESTDEGAMTLEEYANVKGWALA